MADFNLGAFRLNPRGDYDDTKSYEYLDLVRFKGSGYVVCNEDLIDGTGVVGVAPTGSSTSDQYWMCIVDAGQTPSDSDYEYKGFATCADMIWDYDVTDKIIVPLATDTNILTINNVYDGCCGLMVTKNKNITLPANSDYSIDFNYVTLKTGQIYLYSFVYCEYSESGGRFLWNRTVMDE